MEIWCSRSRRRMRSEWWLSGRLIDRLGTRLGYALTMVFWSLASMGHAFAIVIHWLDCGSVALGFGEAGVFPASIKALPNGFQIKSGRLQLEFSMPERTSAR